MFRGTTVTLFACFIANFSAKLLKKIVMVQCTSRLWMTLKRMLLLSLQQGILKFINVINLMYCNYTNLRMYWLLHGIAYFRVVIGSTNGGGFNYLCGSQDEKIQRISRLLNGPLGEKLCSMYISCWKQPELAHCLKEAALYTKSTIASLSVSKVVS